MKTITRGVIHGTTINLERATGLAEGQAVSVTLEPIVDPAAEPGAGIRESAGGWADEAEDLDKFLEWNRQQRKQETRRSFDE